MDAKASRKRHKISELPEIEIIFLAPRSRFLKGPALGCHKIVAEWRGSRARAGHAIDPEIFMTGAGQRVTFTPLLGGLVGAWLFRMA